MQRAAQQKIPSGEHEIFRAVMDVCDDRGNAQKWDDLVQKMQITKIPRWNPTTVIQTAVGELVKMHLVVKDETLVERTKEALFAYIDNPNGKHQAAQVIAERTRFYHNILAVPDDRAVPTGPGLDQRVDIMERSLGLLESVYAKTKTLSLR